MNSIMRYAQVTSLMCVALVMLGWSATSEAVPAFARQTGMNCNSCHNGTDNVPNFTHTGRLFAMRGYIKPHVRERLRANGNDGDWEEGEDNEHYGGNYLALNWDEFFSARMLSTFYEDGKTATGGDRDADSTMLDRMALFYTGAITDWLGLWTEIAYLGNNSLASVHSDNPGQQTGLNLFAFDEYRLSASFDLNNNSFWGISATNEHPHSLAQFNFPVVLPDMWYTGQGGSGSAFDRSTLSPYVLWNERWWVQYGLDSGATNGNWSNGVNHYASVFYNWSNRQQNDIWIGAELYTGRDTIAVTNLGPRASFICTGSVSGADDPDCPDGITDSEFSFRNALGYTAAVVVDMPVQEQVDDFMSYKLAFHQTVADLGVHTWTAGVVLHGMDQDFISGGNAERTILGGSFRYYWNRTYGFEVYARKDLTYDYTEGSGVSHEIEVPSLVYGMTALWTPAMNFNFHLTFRPTFAYAIDPAIANARDDGYTYSIGIEYNF